MLEKGRRSVTFKPINQSINQCLFFSATIFDFPRKEGFYSSHTGSITSLEISQHAQGSQIELHQVV